MRDIGTTVESTLSDHEILLEAARPDLFRMDAFRVAELPVDATARDLVKRQQIIEMACNAGLAAPPGPGRALPLEHSSDPNTIREALQRLRDPERRLVDEFFWFWPAQLGHSQDDQVLQVLAQSDVKSASELWLHQERYSEANVSMHNLAVLSHVAALDLENLSLSHPLSERQRQLRDLYWQQAFKRWRILLEHEGFWSRLTARIRELDDPRLTAGTARRMRGSLPLALLLINGQLAAAAAERGDSAEVKRHLAIMQIVSGSEPPVVAEALRRSVEPTRERIKTLCKIAESDADTDPAHADEVARRLIQHTTLLLTVLDHLLPVDHPTRQSMHDEVARRSLSCVVAFGNKTENWKIVVELLDLILPIAASESVRTRIKENRESAENNRSAGLCWFCSSRPADSRAVIEVKMFGDVTRTPTYMGTQIQWRKTTVTVPRCLPCKSTHDRGNAFA